jgi:NAD(P)-dependent dehydrogenase (short-subunit alcohol dehydrogenase family)
VVNDLGGSIEGTGSDARPAEVVAAEFGGLADASDVSTVEGASALIDAAVDTYGRLDIVVNNAGIMRWAELPSAEDLDAHLAVHVAGSLNTTRAAWTHFVEQGYGRVVMTTSAGVFGLKNNVAYATAKGGVIGLTRSLAQAGRKVGVQVNAIAPAAATRMGGDTESGELAPELAAPMVGFLAHEACSANGEIYVAGGGRFARIFLAQTSGVRIDGTPTIEDVADHWADIGDESGYSVPADLIDWSTAFTDPP